MSLKFIVLACLAATTYAQQPNHEQLLYPSSDSYKINRVIGGTDAAKAEFPHQVSLQWGYPPYLRYSHMCGGSIVNENWILTAAHCVDKLPQNGNLIVRAGKHFIKSPEATEQASHVSQIIIHNGYRGEVSPNDIALLKLTTPLRLNAYVTAIALPKPNVIPQGMAILSGWGSISKTTTPYLPDVLQKVNLPLLDNATCRRAMRLKGDGGEIHETNVCTGPLTGGYSACSGDSGGPLILRTATGSSELVGIVSWGLVPCGSYGSPAVFVRVSAFIDWIENAIKVNSH